MLDSVIVKKPAMYGGNTSYSVDLSGGETGFTVKSPVTHIRKELSNPFDMKVVEAFNLYSHEFAIASTYAGAADRSYFNSSGVLVFEDTDANPIVETLGDWASLRIEPEGFNLLLDTRNMDNASTHWHEGNTGTAAQNATGADGVANKATTITDADALNHYYK